MSSSISATFNFEDQTSLAQFWKALHDLLAAHPQISLSLGVVGDEIHLAVYYKMYAQFLASGQTPDPSFPVLIASSGEHFWKFADTLYANNQDIFSAPEIYPTRQALELIVGPTTEPVVTGT